ncbi:MAG: hypothetical protein IJJ59_14460 [Pseudobutyrivibrio sp.]|uniref:hypothetical protein n=1 Tax=Pseudobutyrivibrio sp. TaxID=2014367 RepID=UPI0025CE1A70|nr:hypothetical protein [Pseudobutyrivibrio sp.]MBQ6464526.1 hypothetical protein [Pseudobutyrivibrio sp.]
MGNSVAEEAVKVNYSSVESFAKDVKTGSQGLGMDFKDEYKDLKSTIVACGNFESSLNGEWSLRNTLKLMSERESNQLLNISDEFGIMDEQIADMLNPEFNSI